MQYTPQCKNIRIVNYSTVPRRGYKQIAYDETIDEEIRVIFANSGLYVVMNESIYEIDTAT